MLWRPNEHLVWSTEDKGRHIACTGTSIKNIGTEGRNNRSLIRTTNPISRSTKDFYFEITVVETSSYETIAIGLTKSTIESTEYTMPGCEKGTIGYHSDVGRLFHETTDTFKLLQKFGKGDTVGCSMNRIFLDGKKHQICILAILSPCICCIWVVAFGVPRPHRKLAKSSPHAMQKSP